MNFKKWLEAGNVSPDQVPAITGGVPWPDVWRYPKDKKDTGPGRDPDTSTNAFADFSEPGSDNLPPDRLARLKEPKLMSKQATRGRRRFLGSRRKN